MIENSAQANKVYDKAWAMWGPAQYVVAMEEFIELSMVCSKLYRSGTITPELAVALVEEIADVEIMIAQLKRILENNEFEVEDQVFKMKGDKLNRLVNRLADQRISNEQVFKEICRIILEASDCNLLEGQGIALTDELRKDLGIDSLDYVEILMGVEEFFDLEVPESENDQFVTVCDLYEFVLKNRKV